MSISVMITTKHRGVFLAKTTNETDLTARSVVKLKDVKMLIRWRNGDGLSGVAKYGPTDNCKVSSACDVEVLHDVTGVFNITKEAEKKIWLP